VSTVGVRMLSLTG